MHDYIIGALIVIIVAIQFLVALTTSKKITLFKSIVPDVNNFETIKVFIPEHQIKSIKVEEILNNVNDYNGMPPFNIEIQEEIVEEKDTDILNSIEDIKSKKNDDELSIDDEVDYDLFGKTIDSDEIEERTIWMVKNFSERKIKKSQINHYIDTGWSLLKDNQYGS